MLLVLCGNNLVSAIHLSDTTHCGSYKNATDVRVIAPDLIMPESKLDGRYIDRW
jgi:hypothetical protein